MKTSVIQEGLRVELLLVHIERSCLRWFRHLTRVLPGQLLLRNVLLGGGPRTDPGHIGGDYISWLSPWKTWRKCLGGGLAISAEIAAAADDG